MTLDGTNTWVLVAPGGDRRRRRRPRPARRGSPGPGAPGRARRGGPGSSEVLLTHGHLDHSEGAALRRAGRAAGPAAAWRCGPSTRRTGWVRRVWARATWCRAGDLVLRVVGTPGHTSDSLSFLLPAEGAVLTGDTVLGRGSTVVAHPDGRLAAYLESLDRLRDLAEGGAVTSILPGHGPVLPDAMAAIEAYQEHRAERLDQVRGGPRRRSRDPAGGRRAGLRRRRPGPLAGRRAVRARPARLPHRAPPTRVAGG